MQDYIVKYWAGWLCGLVATGLAWLGRKYKCMSKKQSAIENGMQALLRAQIIHIYNKYIEIGSVPIHERENIEALYTQYTSLGGNGVIKELVEKLERLPTPNDPGGKT